MPGTLPRRCDQSSRSKRAASPQSAFSTAMRIPAAPVADGRWRIETGEGPLDSGDVVVATEVTAGDAKWLAGLALNEELFGGVALGGRRVVKGSLAGAEAVVQGQSCKAALRLETIGRDGNLPGAAPAQPRDARDAELRERAAPTSAPDRA